MKQYFSDDSIDFFERLLKTISPSGCEFEARDLFLEYISPFCDEVTSDVMCNSIAVLNQKSPFKVMLTAHYDEVGFQIVHITDEGMLHFQAFGDINPKIIAGRKVEILTRNGHLQGVIGAKPVHLIEVGENDGFDISDLWMDIGAESKQEALDMVRIGDMAVLKGPYATLNDKYVTSRGLDDKIGVFILAETMKRLSQMNLNAAVYCAATAQEELGFRGVGPCAYEIDPQVGIAVDVGFATDVPDMKKEKYGDLRLGGGPALIRNADNNRQLVDSLMKVAENHKLNFQVNTTFRPTSKSDSERIQTIRSGVATATIHIPCRYMHSSVEMCHWNDIFEAVRLLTEFIVSLNGDESFEI